MENGERRRISWDSTHFDDNLVTFRITKSAVILLTIDQKPRLQFTILFRCFFKIFFIAATIRGWLLLESGSLGSRGIATTTEIGSLVLATSLNR